MVIVRLMMAEVMPTQGWREVLEVYLHRVNSEERVRLEASTKQY